MATTLIIAPLSQTAKASSADDLRKQALSISYLYSLQSCIQDSNANGFGELADSGGFLAAGTAITEAHAKSGDWFRSNTTWNAIDFSTYVRPASYLDPNINQGDANDGQTLCTSIVKSATSTWGYSDSLELLCSFVSTRSNGSSCKTGNGDFGTIDSTAGKFHDAVVKKVFGGTEPTITDPQWYILYETAFMTGCSPKPSTNPAPNFKYTVRTLDSSGAVAAKGITYEGVKRDTNRYVTTQKGPNLLQKTCADIADGVNKYADAYAQWLIQHPDSANTGQSSGNNCPSGQSQDSSGACVAPGATKTSCVIDGVGWIVCTAANFLAKTVDAVYGLIKQMLTVPPLNTNVSDGRNGVYNAWGVMRSFANVVFVILFLIIIFSQLTGAGVSNYGVKKTLPKLVIAAVLVNVSYWIGAVAVDVSNIAGQGIYDALANVKDQMNIGDLSQNWGNIVTALLAGDAIAISGGALVTGAAAVTAGLVVAAGPEAIIALALLVIPLLLAAVLAVLIVAFLLIARQAMVVILILVSPLAFAAMLLPNTERYFKKWSQLLLTMLTMFPLVSIVFGGAQIAGLAITSTAGTTKDPVATGLAIIIGQLVMVLPFFFLFTLIRKFSGSELAGWAGKIQASGKRAIGGIKKLTNPIANRKLGLAKSNIQSGNIRRRYRRDGSETLMSRLGGASAGMVGGTMNAFGRSKHVDETLTKANDEAIQRGHKTSAAGQAAGQILHDAQLETKISEDLEHAHFENHAPVDLKLRAKVADVELQNAKGATNRAAVEAATLYAQAERTGDQAVAAQAAARAGGDMAIAHQLHEGHITSAVNSEATNIAGRLQQYEYAQQIKNPANSALLEDAAGIGGERAQSSVRASAQAVVNDAATKAITAEKTLLTGKSNAELVAQYQNGTLSDEARAAALGRIVEVGTDDEIYAALDYAASQAGSSAGVALQQQFVADVGSRKPVSLGGGAISQLKNGSFSGTFMGEVADRLNKGKVGAASAAGATADELQKMRIAIQAMPVKGPELQKLRDDIRAHLSNPNIAQPTPEIAKLMEDIANSIT
ncbi:MAG TPA: hypothetical protein VN081_01750 [Dongiaceae bacterium]|nr:hypothetical protein [Dongiaceae bacterium]